MGLQDPWTAAAVGLVDKPCGSCKTLAAALFCRAHLAFLCLACDSRIHPANKLTASHQRVWMCGVCQQAPAAVTCKADAAALCVSCDADIHSANPLARRHERVPVEPFYDAAESIVVKSTTGLSSAAAALNYLVPNGDVVFNTKDIENNAASSWLIPNPNFNSKLHMDIAPDILKSSDDLIFPEMDSLLEFDYPTSVHTISGSGACNDSVVPVQPDPIPPPSFNMNYNVSGPADHNCFDLDFCRSKLYSSFSYPTQSLSQSVSSSSLDAGVVPDGNSLSDKPYLFGRNASSNGSEPGDISYSFGPKANNKVSEAGVPVSATPVSQPATQLCGLDREARVLRYREKRKKRKFQKTIRYASRKAYAETRPRIKGRFAKRNKTETDVVDRIYCSRPGTYIPDPQFGVVPTF
ncbi:hypothetical protein C1H46_000410 [Malus baccata]|uniref:Uncharacterized protein n=1 Tax=Malus baccata TaxID=106549 RepID=A0A540NSG6_MALBA|nr:hypothetical protein C1H46_000410 [Malus baccata]